MPSLSSADDGRASSCDAMLRFHSMHRWQRPLRCLTLLNMAFNFRAAAPGKQNLPVLCWVD